MLKLRQIAAFALVAVALPGAAVATGYGDAAEAYQRGDFAAALRELKPLAADDARAQYLLGVMNQTGQGVLKNDVQASEWYRKAAMHGHADAQFSIGWLYAQGVGVQRDERIAVEWYRKAAEQGQAKAQHGLGFMYLNGRGVAQDQRVGADWVRKAADQGDVDAQAELGVLYLRGAGVARDKCERLSGSAVFWL